MKKLHDFEHKITENDQFVMVNTDICESFTKQFRSYDRDGISLDGWFVLRAIPKDGSAEMYIGFDSHGVPQVSFSGYDDVDFKLMLLKMRYADENNVINMAKELLPEDHPSKQEPDVISRFDRSRGSYRKR